MASSEARELQVPFSDEGRLKTALPVAGTLMTSSPSVFFPT